MFISYRRQDSAYIAGRLHDVLASQFGKHRVFRDIDTMGPGTDFVQAIRAGVDGCDAVVVVIGNGWLDAAGEDGSRRLDDPNDWVRLEIANGLEQGALVVPVLVEGARMPAEADLPDPLKPLARRNALDLTDERWDYDVGSLVGAIRGGAADRSTTEGATRRGRATSRARLARLAAVPLAVALAALGAWRLTSGGGGGDSAHEDLAGEDEPAFYIGIGDEVGTNHPNAGAGVIAVPREVDTYLFDAVAGQRVFVNVTGDCQTPLRLDLGRPGLDPIFVGQQMSGDGVCLDAGPVTLPDAAAYALTVRAIGDATGPYHFRLWDVPPPTEFGLTAGVEVRPGSPGPGAGSIETPGAEDVYTFVATPGQRISLAVSGGCHTNLRWDLGRRGEDPIFSYDQLSGAGVCHSKGPFALPPGAYELRVYGTGGAIGDYRFRLLAE